MKLIKKLNETAVYQKQDGILVVHSNNSDELRRANLKEMFPENHQQFEWRATDREWTNKQYLLFIPSYSSFDLK